jgi:crossover junction endodeoxyribonuclease RusA
MSYQFFVPGKPVPQGSKRHVGNGILIESAKGLKDWRSSIAFMATNGPYIERPTPVSVHVVFVMPRPKSTPKQTPPAVKRPDVDKLARGVLDALSSVSYDDDSQVTSLSVHKRLAEPGEASGAHIYIRPAVRADWLSEGKLV